MSPSQRSIERRAEELLTDLGERLPPVPVEAIAVERGIEIQRRPGSPDISGLLYREDGRVVIGLNDDDGFVRQRFTIAHELGHFFLHEGNEVIHIDRDLRVNLRTRESHGGEEREANWFAAALLMPRELVRRVATEISEGRRQSDETLIGALAERFEVSRQAMGYRLLNLGLLSGV